MKHYYLYLIILFSLGTHAQNYYGTPVPGIQVVQSPPPSIAISESAAPVTASISAAKTPTGNSTEIGITEGQLSVSLTGAANYSVPVSLPPGINGVAPEIGLTYDSQSGNGIAGYGWSIAGLSSITRIQSTTYHDGIIDPVDYNNLDRFAFNGQRLILKSGSYGGNGAIYETETFSNIKITSIGVSPFGANYGPNYFKVEYPDGSYALYGNTATSNSRNEWSISYWQNPQGVSIIYEYSYDSAANSKLIAKIKYGSLLQNTPVNEISFGYSTRTRPEQAYVGNQNYAISSILSNITIKSNGLNYKTYSLGHEISNLGYQRLTTIREGDGANSSYNPTVFTYENTPISITYNPLTTVTLPDFSNIAVNNTMTMSADYSGDGSLDFLLYGNLTSAEKNRYWVYYDLKSVSGPKLVGDSNIGQFEAIFPVNYLSGDASYGYKIMPDPGWVVIKNESGVVKFRTYCLSLNTAIQGINFQNEVAINGGSIGGIANNYFSGDFNGDGLTDILSVTKATGQAYFINLDKRLGTHSSVVGSMLSTIGATDKVMMGDFNGDGKSDLFHFKNNQLYVYGFNSNNNFVLLYQIVSDPSIIITNQILLGDYNGDGKMDFLVPVAAGSTQYTKYLSTGTTYVKSSINLSNFPYILGNSSSTQHYIPTDFNNDGKTDLIQLTANGSVGGAGSITIRSLSNFNNMGDSTATVNVVQTPNQAGLDMWALPLYLTPDKGNPKLEIAAIRDKKIHYFQSQKDFSRDKLLKTITTGNGVVESITYGQMMNTCTTPGCIPDYYSDKLQLNYPDFDIVASPAFNIVSKLERQSNDAFQTQSYRFLGAVTNLEGRGFSGYKAILKTNWYTDYNDLISNVSKFDIEKRGALIESYNVLDWGTLSFDYSPTNYITKSIYSYQDQLQSNKVYKLTQTNLSEYDGLENTAKTTDYSSYDEYNNLLTQSYSQSKKQGSTYVLERSGVRTYEYNNNPSGAIYSIGKLTKKIATATYGASTMASEEQYTYSPQLLLTQLKKKGDNTDYITEDYTYDTFGNITQKKLTVAGIAPRQNNFEYDPSGRFITKAIDIEGLVNNYITDPNKGLLSSTTNQCGLTTQYFYNTFGKKIKVTDYLGKNQTITYKVLPLGMSEVVVAGEDESSEYVRYDDLMRVIIKGAKNVDGNWSYVKMGYDGNNRPITMSEPYSDLATTPTQISTTAYDAYGRIRQLNSYTGKTTTITYSGLTTTSNDGTHTESTVKNTDGSIASKTDDGGTIEYQYYANGALKQAGLGNALTLIEQDGWGRKIKLTDPSAGIYRYEYNDFGELTKETTPTGTTTYTLDGLGKVNQKTIIGDYTNTTITNSYDANTKLITQSNFNDGSTPITYNYTYDSYKRLIATKESGEYVYDKEVTYDEFGRPLKQYYKATQQSNTAAMSEKWVRNSYKNGKHYQIVDDATNVVLWQVASVNSRGQLTSATLGNGYILSNTYDQYGFISEKKYGSSIFSTTPLETVKLGYSFNAAKGLLDSRTNSLFNWNESFQYDNLDRLTKSPKFIPLFDDKFNQGLANFQAGENATVINEAGKLKVTAINAYNGISKKVLGNAKVGDKLIFSVKVDRGTTNKVRIMVVEEDENSTAWNQSFKGITPTLRPVGGTTFTFEHTVTQYGNVSINIQKSEESSDIGTATYFTVDDLVVNLAVNEQQDYDEKGRVTSNAMGEYQYENSAKPYQQTSLNYSDKAFDYYTNKMPDLYMEGMESQSGWDIKSAHANIGGITYDTSKSHTGSYSLKIAKPTAGESYVHSSVTIPIDNAVATEYTYSAWVYSDGPQSEIFLFMKNVDEPSYFTNIDNKTTLATGSWVKIENTVLVPANIKTLNIRLDNNGGGNVWFDDIKIIKNTTGGAVGNRDLYVTYNAFNDPVDLEETGKDKISFKYNINNQRSAIYYGSLDNDKMARPLRKNYSADGSMEVKYNALTGKTEFITYIGGNGYSAPVVYKSTAESQEYLYLHRDYQGSIVAISNGTGKIVEKRLYDAWGEVIKVVDGSGNMLDGLTILDRGYTGHEHLQSVGLIHMNGRLYDPKLHRFLQADNNIQNPYNSQNYNRYGYALNNPLKYIDPSGESYSPNENGGSEWQQSIIGNAALTIKENWGPIKDWFNNEFSNGVKSAGNWATNQLKSVNNVIDKALRGIGKFLGLDKKRGSDKPGWDPQHSGQISSSWQSVGFQMTPSITHNNEDISLIRDMQNLGEISTIAEGITEVSEAMGIASPVLKKVGGIAGSVGSIIEFYNIYENYHLYKHDKMTGKRFSYKIGTTTFNAGIGVTIGAMGGANTGLYGFTFGVLLGETFDVIDEAYIIIAPQVRHGFNNFMNSLKASISLHH